MAFISYVNETNLKIKAGMERNVKAATLALHGAIIRRLTGSRTGRMYRVPGGKTKMYTASAPGESPATASGVLRGSVDFDVDGTVGRAGTPKAYGKYLEEGTKKMEARPFISPAKDDARAQIERELARVIE